MEMVMPKQEKIEITLYTDLEPVYGGRGGRLSPRVGEPSKSDPPEFRGLLEQLIVVMKADKFSFRHYYDDGTVRDFEPWE